MEKLNLALDWTPNINHIGFFVALEKGFYEASGLKVQITDPSVDNYKITPAKKVELGEADFALCPTESIISYRTKTNPFDLIAIVAILQEDLSAIVVKSDSGIRTPKDLDGRIYSSYKARYEDGIVRAMVQNDGGVGDLKITYPDKLGIWNTLLDGKADSTWIFLNWEGVAAKAFADQLSYFKMKDYRIPYSYSPVIAARELVIAKKKAQYKAFIQASKKGFLYCQQHPEEAVKILSKYIPHSDREIDLAEALKVTAPHFGTEKNWGTMSKDVVLNFINWIVEKGLESKPISIAQIMTDEYLK